MSTKPATTPAFDTNFTNVSAPTSSEITDGYPTDAVPTSATWNYLIAWLCAWAKYVSDGDVALNDVEIAGTLKVDGATEFVDDATCDAALEVKGTATFDASGKVTFEGPVYRTTLQQSGLSFNAGTSTNTASATPAVLTTTGAWTWHGPLFGVSGDFVTSFWTAAAVSTAADSVTWTLLKTSLDPVTGAIATATVATGTWTLAASTQAAYFATIPSESVSNEPLDSESLYVIQLSGSASGVALQGGIRYATTRPIAV